MFKRPHNEKIKEQIMLIAKEQGRIPRYHGTSDWLFGHLVRELNAPSNALQVYVEVEDHLVEVFIQPRSNTLPIPKVEIMPPDSPSHPFMLLADVPEYCLRKGDRVDRVSRGERNGWVVQWVHPLDGYRKGWVQSHEIAPAVKG